MAKTSFYSGSGPDSNDVSALENLKNQAQTSATNAASSASSAAASASSAAASVASLNEDVATQSTKGLMSAADKTKLDGVESGATADQTAAEIKTAYESNSDTNAFTDAFQTKLSGIESSADVTDTTNVTAAGALMDSELTSLSGIKTLTVPDSTTVSTFGASLVDDADAAAARTTLGLGSSDSPTFAGMTVDGDAVFGTNDRVMLGIQGATNALQLYYFGNSFIENNAVADLLIRNNANNYDVKIQSDNGSGGLAEYFVADGSTGAAQLHWGDYSTNSGADGGLKLTSSATGIDVTGSITVSGTVDGRDVAADGTKLDTVETNADVTDAANVQAAGALMDSELTSEASVKAINQGLTTTDSPTFAALSVSGKTTTNELDLNAIAATISDTAVDIFVYDTRKDSDGGAWRKRTQHTSWYNETLNTATRGSRKEFPAVAVIVAETNQVTIYDGDDPSLPMWLTYTGESNISSISALNGRVFYGNNNGGNTVDYLMDKYLLGYRSSGTRYYLRLNASSGAISFSNTAPSSGDLIGTIVNNTVNDVAMTVLPNAPIDAATGLPVPTIAVATDGGVSVIKDDGTVVDDTYSYNGFVDAKDIDFMGSGYLRNARSSGLQTARRKQIPSADISTQGDDWYYANSSAGASGNLVARFNANTMAHQAVTSDSEFVVGQDINGISLIKEYTNPLQGGFKIASISNNYNTGWMNGDIKLATLSDTDATNVTGSGNLITDPSSFSSNGFITETGGVITASAADTYSHTGVTTVLGQKYYAEVNHTQGSTCTFYVTDAADTTIVSQSGLTTAGIVRLSFTGTGSTVKLKFTNNNTFSIQDIGIYATVEDRSVSGNGLQVFGTVTKSAVATGADLVAYSGFNASNYLQQPYNSAMDIDATDDVCVIAWAKLGTANSYIFDRTDDANAGARYFAYRRGGSDDKLVFMGLQSSTAFDDTFVAGWHQYTLLRRSGTIEIWVDGKLDATGADTQDRTNTSAKLTIGNNYTQGAFNGASALALFRFSATAPSPEQIARIYNDEKHLFTEGAQATLYGSSDSVTALAFDDTTNLLHVGTSAGRSVFQGLRRVDNTTTAVTSAISASNGLVADE